MKAIRRISALLVLTLVFALCFVLTACGGECDEHTFGDWTVVTDSTCSAEGQKTRQCTECDHVETDTIAKKEHTGEWVKNGTTETITCTVCGATETRDIACTGHTGGIVCDTCGARTVALEKILPQLAELSNVGIVVKDVVIDTTVEDPEYGEITEIELFEFVFYADENGALKGYGEGAVSIKDDADSDAEQIAFVGTLEGGTLYMAIDGAMNGIPASMNVALKVENLGALSGQTAMATEMIEQYLPAIEAWINESLLPVFGTPTIEGDFNEEEITAAATDAAYAIADALFTVTETADGKTLTLSLDFIKSINAELSTLKVSELINKYAGETAFAQLKATAIELLPFSVGTALNFVTSSLDVDVDALLTSLDELAVIITGSDTATFEMLIQFEGDISEMIKDPEVLAYSVKDFLIANTDCTNELELVTAINDAFARLEQNTVYTLAGLTAEDVTKIDETVDALSEMISLTVSLDKDGKLAGVNATVALPADEEGDATEITLNVVADKMTVSVDGVGTTLTAELILNSEIEADAEKAAAIIAAVNSVPEFDEELIAALGCLPIYDGEEIIGIIFDYDVYNVTTEGDVAYLEVYQEAVYLSDVAIYGMAEGCGDSILVIYMVPSYYETAVYSITREALEEKVGTDATMEQNEIAAILYGEREIVESELYDMADLDFAYDTVTGDVTTQLSGPYGHSIKLDQENSDDMSTLTCGDAYSLTYCCENCDFTFTQKGKVQHNYELNEEESVWGEVCGDETVYVYNCTACGDTYEETDTVGHSYMLDYENSIFGETCGDAIVYIYVCTCGDSYEETDVVGHSYVYTYTKIDENVYQGDRVCGDCGEGAMTSHQYTIVAEEGVTVEMMENETDETLDFTLTVTTSGTYRIYAVGPEYGMYAHFYRSEPNFEWLGSSDDTEDGYEMILDLSGEEAYYFSSYFYGLEYDCYDEMVSGTIYIELIEAAE